jgi:uncharacterized protein YjbI with pentapeptide repeats
VEPKKPALSSKSGSEKASGPWRPTKRQVLWALWVIGMVVALLTTALLIVYLHPEIWKGLLEERNLTRIALGVSVTAIIVLLAFGLAFSGAARSWTGFRGKTLWDLLQLLIVPLALAVFGLWFAAQQDARQQQLEGQRAQNAALQAYLDQMLQLMLNGNLRSSQAHSEVRALARARTLTALGFLDSERNSAILQFLREAQLISGTDPVVRLSHSNLHGAELRGANLSGIHLSGSYLKRANLSYANLTSAEVSGAKMSNADLSWASLSGANLNDAHLYNADLSYANLVDANLSNADLNDANLSNADLSYANLSEAFLWGADLTRANLTKADLREADLRGVKGITGEKLEQQASSLRGATMPNGQKYEEWLKSKNREEGGKNE